MSGGTPCTNLYLTHISNCPLRYSSFICYKQFTESICVAGWALFCNSRARLAPKGFKGLTPKMSRPRDLIRKHW